MSMEVEQPSLSSHHEEQTGDNDNSNWRRRLRLRKSSASFHTVKSRIEEQKVNKDLTKETSENEHKGCQVVNTESCKLTFTCSLCNDGTRFSPDGLLNHFESFHGGKGQAPSFPCNICNFVTSDFSTLQQHYQKCKHFRLTYEMCTDKGLQTSSQIEKHCKNHNQHKCEKCEFSAKELTQFLHHSRNTVLAIENSQKSDIKAINSALNRNILADAAGKPKKEAALEHCHRGWIKKNLWRNRGVAPKQPKHTAPDTKCVIPKSKMSWTAAPFLPFSAAGLLDKNGKLLHPTRTLEKTKQFLQKTVNCGQKWPVTLKDEPGSLPSEPCALPLSVLNPGSHLSGFMEKNNISVPPDCTTKVVGFKMVAGKKHLVLKVIPSAKSEISLEPMKNPARLLTQDEINDKIARPSNQMGISESSDSLLADCTKNVYQNSKESTTTSCQLQKPALYEETIGDTPQVDKTKYDCSNEKGPFTVGHDAPAQSTPVRVKNVLDVASQAKNQNSASPLVTFNAKETFDVNGEIANVSGVKHSVRKQDIPTLQINMMTVKEITDTMKHTDNPDKANKYKDMNSEPSRSQDERRCMKALASCISSDSVCIQDGIDFQLQDRSPDIYVKNMKKMSGSEIPRIHSTLDDRTKEKMKNSLTSNANEVAMLESGFIDSVVASPPKTTTDYRLISLSEHESLCIQHSEDENMNNINSRYSTVCIDPTFIAKTLQKPNLSELSLQNNFYNPDLYQTLEELPFTTVSHLLDDSEVAHRGMTSQSEAGSMDVPQVSVHSSKAIPVTAVSTDKESSQLSLRTEPVSKKRHQEPTSKDFQRLVSKSKKRLVENSQENEFSASMPYWELPPPDIERTLRLLPFCSSQAIKVPHRNQPVVVLNHPDTDIPEVANIMKTVHKHKGAVQRVVLTQGTLKALSELNCVTFRNKCLDASQSSRYRRVWAEGTVKERFILNLKLKRLGENKFKVADISVNANHIQLSFTCWFCGRHFRNQEVWVGHAQRHIMEATRDWNKLFKKEVQGNSADQQSIF